MPTLSSHCLLLLLVLFSTVACGAKEDDDARDPVCEAFVEHIDECGEVEDDVVYTCPKDGHANDWETCGYQCGINSTCEELSTKYLDCVNACPPPE